MERPGRLLGLAVQASTEDKVSTVNALVMVYLSNTHKYYWQATYTVEVTTSTCYEKCQRSFVDFSRRVVGSDRLMSV